VRVDRAFGPQTEAAVRAFQRDNGLVEDGIVGAKTWAALKGKERVQAAPRQDTPLDALADKAVEIGSKGGGAIALFEGARRALPDGAFTALAYGAVALALVVGGVWVYRNFVERDA